MKPDYDLVIVGAGPAGASAAYFSRIFDEKKTLNILLLESLGKQKFTRYHHMCGEVVSKRIERDFPSLNLSHFTINTINRFCEFWGEKEKIQSPLAGYVIDRPKILSHLIDEFIHKGGNFLQEKVVNYTEKKDKIELMLEKKGKISTKYLIIAAGPKKPIGNGPEIDGDVFNSLLYQIVVKGYPLEKNCVEFYYDERYKENYKWIFPYGDFVKIGVPYENKNELKKYEKYRIIRKDIKPVCCGVLKNYTMNNLLFVGDAAYQNNPLTKGGIRSAINAGKTAAEALVKYNDPSRYDLMWKNSGFFTGPYIAACRQLRTMKNWELIYHIKPLKYYPLSAPWIVFKYRKYLSLYKTYNASRKYGW